MSFLWESVSWFWSRLWSYLGLSNKTGSLLVIGLDNAGKTTLLYALQTGGDIRPFPPTDRPNINRFRIQGIQFTAWDLGGHEAVRHLWEDYVSETVQAVLFVLDAADDSRIEEAAYELDALIFEHHLLDHIPIAILLNKCDLETALSTQEICQRIEYDKIKQQQGEDRISIWRISVLKGEGYPEAFRWISTFLK